MKEIKLKPRYVVALSCILLVLVVSLLAYSVYVPKLQEVENLKTQVTVAKIEQARLRKIPVAKKVLPEDKAKLAALVPTDFDQTRFLKGVRGAEHDTSVQLTDIMFQEQESGDATGVQTAPQSTAQQVNTAVANQTGSKPVPANGSAKKQSALTEQNGHLTVTGDYKQVRQFLDRFSQMSRLISFNHWDLKAVDKAQNFTLYAYRPAAAQLANALSIVNRDPLLSNRKPISGEKEYNAIRNQIMRKAPSLKTQQEKDLANLEIQQTQNRLMAGLMNQQEAVSILDQPYAGAYIQDANTNIREVLGLESGAPSQASSAPTSLLGNPVQTINSTAAFKTQVTLDIDFTIYYAPNAKGLLPAPSSIKTYDPTERTDPVEMR
jgi:Tfp pilus assembly protein PilO